MSTSQATKSMTPTKLNYRFWGQPFALLIVLGILGYYGYCYGLWGRNSLLLQYLFQCNCPLFSEELHYPKEVNVIVSACQNIDVTDVTLSPSGRLLYLKQNRDSFTGSDYLLNLETNKNTPLSRTKGTNFLLTDDLIFHSFYGDDEYILDMTTGIKYPIQDARQGQPSIYVMGNIEPGLLLKALAQVDQIFFIDDLFQPVIALSSDFRSHPENTFAFNTLDFSSDDLDSMEQFLQQNNIAYHRVPGRFSDELPSQDARFVARPDGIYLIKTNQVIAETRDSRLLGWIYDGRGAIYTSNRCLFLLSLPGLDVTCLATVPQPVILLQVPEEHLAGKP